MEMKRVRMIGVFMAVLALSYLNNAQKTDFGAHL
jgi:hypothetical protein